MSGSSSKLPVAIVTGASSGIGATYADRLARRGHGLVLVARDAARLAALAERLARETSVEVATLPADLGTGSGLALVVERLADPRIGMLVNSAGLGPQGPMLASTPGHLDAMLRLNVTALHALTLAAARGFTVRGGGTIVNIASVVALVPERFNATYSATKAFVLALTQGLAAELDGQVRLQAVLPGLTRTEIFERAGMETARLDARRVMEAGAMVDAALAGLDAGELVTIPSLPDAADWAAFESARARLAPNLSHAAPAARYRAA